jgi:hypothetical protein
MMASDKRPVMDEGEPYRERPFHAGGPQGELAGRKSALLSTGSTGFLPGRPGSLERAGHVYEAPQKSGKVPGFDDLEYGPSPHPREIPVHSQTTHMGSIVRYLDGHSEIYRERPGLVEMMNHPATHPDDAEDIRQEIADRDEINKHEFW